MDILTPTYVELRSEKGCFEGCDGCKFSSQYKEKSELIISDVKLKSLGLINQLYRTKSGIIYTTNSINFPLIDIDIKNNKSLIYKKDQLTFDIDSKELNISNIKDYIKKLKEVLLIGGYNDFKPSLRLRLMGEIHNIDEVWKLIEEVNKIEGYNEYTIFQFGSNMLNIKNLENSIDNLRNFLNKINNSYGIVEKDIKTINNGKAKATKAQFIIKNDEEKIFEIIHRNIIKGSTISKDELKSQILSFGLNFSFFKEYIQFQHTSMSVNDKNTQISYKEFDEMLREYISIKENTEDSSLEEMLKKYSNNYIEEEALSIEKLIISSKGTEEYQGKKVIENNMGLYNSHFQLKNLIYSTYLK